MGNLPTRKGPWIGRGNERQMMSETNVSEFRKRYRTNPDGSTTMLKTRGGFPQFTTNETKQQTPLGPREWIFQATTRLGYPWKSDSYLSKTKNPALVLNEKEFIGHANWFGVADALPVTISHSAAGTEYGGLFRLLNYGGNLPGVVFRNGEKILDLAGAAMPGYEPYEAGASLICAGMSSGVPIAVIKIRYYTDTTSELALIRMAAGASYGSVVGWEFVSSISIGWGEPILYQPAVMNSSGTAFSAVVMHLVDDSNADDNLWKYDLRVRTWALPTFGHTDSHASTQREYQRTTPWRPGIDIYEDLPGGVSYLKERKASSDYFLEEVVSEDETEVPQFAGYSGDNLIVVRSINKFREVSYHNPLGGEPSRFSNEWVVKSFSLGSAYADNLAILQGLVFDGGHTLSEAQAASQAYAATFGYTGYSVIEGVMPSDISHGINAAKTHFYWREGSGGILYAPHEKFNPLIALSTRLYNSFRRTEFRQGVKISGMDEPIWLGKADTELFGKESGGVVRSISARYDRSPTLNTVSYIATHPLGAAYPSMTISVTRFATDFISLGNNTEILKARPEVSDVENNDPLIWHDARGPLYVRWKLADGQLEARFSAPSTGIADIGELTNVGAPTQVVYTPSEANSSHPSHRIASASLHQGLLNATVLLIDNPDTSPWEPIETTLYHVSQSGVLTEVPEPAEGEVFVTATYFRK